MEPTKNNPTNDKQTPPAAPDPLAHLTETIQAAAALAQGPRTPIEDILIAQARSLNGVFHTLAQRALQVKGFDSKSALENACYAQRNFHATIEKLQHIRDHANYDEWLIREGRRVPPADHISVNKDSKSEQNEGN